MCANGGIFKSGEPTMTGTPMKRARLARTNCKRGAAWSDKIQTFDISI